MPALDTLPGLQVSENMKTKGLSRLLSNPRVFVVEWDFAEINHSAAMAANQSDTP